MSETGKKAALLAVRSNAGLDNPILRLYTVSCHMEAADRVGRSIERGEPQPTYISQRQKEALQFLIDWTLKGHTLMPSEPKVSNV